MEINVSWDDMRKRSLFVATPMYGGLCHGAFASSMMTLAVECARHGIDMQFYTLHNESLITRGRNYCADEFVRSGKTHMLFIDSDITFDPKDVFTLLAIADHEDPTNHYDIIGAAYPKKSISWEKIVHAVNAGFADQNPNDLEKFVGDFVFNPKAGVTQINVGEPCEVRELGTGFMMIKRNTFLAVNDAYPELLYRPDHARTAFFDGSRQIMAYFDCYVENKWNNIIEEAKHFKDSNPDATLDDFVTYVSDPDAGNDKYSKRYLSEDYQFCYTVQKTPMNNEGRMGQVWMCPWMRLQHAGTYIFGGSIAEMARLGASLTVDPSKIVKR